MANYYYYFSASLPSIAFDQKPPITVEDFLHDCARLLSTSDYERVSNVLNDTISGISSSGNDLYGQWVTFNHNLRNEWAAQRATKQNKDPLSYMRGFKESSYEIQEAIMQANKAANPLEGEKIFDQLRWRLLEDLTQGHYFDFDCVLAYGLKLKMLERYENVKSVKGAEIFEEFQKFELKTEALI